MANGMSVEYQFWGSTVSLRAHVYRWMSFLICSCSLLRSSGRSRALRREALALACRAKAAPSMLWQSR